MDWYGVVGLRVDFAVGMDGGEGTGGTNAA